MVVRAQRAAGRHDHAGALEPSRQLGARQARSVQPHEVRLRVGRVHRQVVERVQHPPALLDHESPAPLDLGVADLQRLREARLG